MITRPFTRREVYGMNDEQYNLHLRDSGVNLLSGVIARAIDDRLLRDNKALVSELYRNGDSSHRFREFTMSDYENLLGTIDLKLKKSRTIEKFTEYLMYVDRSAEHREPIDVMDSEHVIIPDSMADVIDFCKAWGVARGLNKVPFDIGALKTNIQEELDEYDEARDIHEKIDARIDAVIYCLVDLCKDGSETITHLRATVDALVALYEEFGYLDMMELFHEVMKEIADRRGGYSEEAGKWVKEPKKEGSYKANFKPIVDRSGR